MFFCVNAHIDQNMRTYFNFNFGECCIRPSKYDGCCGLLKYEHAWFRVLTARSDRFSKPRKLLMCQKIKNSCQPTNDWMSFGKIVQSLSYPRFQKY